MPEIGSLVVYGAHGVCKIAETTVQSINRKKVEYFVLVPVEQAGARYLIPVANEAALSRLRPLLTKEALTQILQDEAKAEAPWIADDGKRKQNYKDMITLADCSGMVHMIHMIHTRRAAKGAANSKIHLCDENFLKDAGRILISEFTIVLDMTRDELLAYIGSLSA